MHITASFHDDWGNGGSQDFTYSASVSKVKAIYYNSGDAAGWHPARKRPLAKVSMRYIRTYPSGPGCEETKDVETISFSGPVSAGFGGLRTELRHRRYVVTDRRISIGFTAYVTVHLFHHSVYDMFDCVTHDEVSDTVMPVEIGAEGSLSRNNRTGEFTIGDWGPVYISSYGIGTGVPPDWLPAAEGSIRLDRDVREAA
jgi:hypothetical protein